MQRSSVGAELLASEVQEGLGGTLPQGVVDEGQLQGLGVGCALKVSMGWAHAGMKSGQDTLCSIVTVTFLHGRWGVPPAGTFSGQVLVFTGAEFSVNKVFKVTLACSQGAGTLRTTGGRGIHWHPVMPFTNQTLHLLTLLQSRKDPGIPDSRWGWPRVPFSHPPFVRWANAQRWRSLSEAMMPMPGRAQICNSLCDLSPLQGILEAKLCLCKVPANQGPQHLLLPWLMLNVISSQTHTVTFAIKSGTSVSPTPTRPCILGSFTHEARQDAEHEKVNADLGALPVQVFCASASHRPHVVAHRRWEHSSGVEHAGLNRCGDRHRLRASASRRHL